jgi:NADPH:quinone reductase-like Zn-dependent oxidoreductase
VRERPGRDGFFTPHSFEQGLRKGTYRVSPDELPIIPGREFAGAIEKAGANAGEFKLGQRVVAYTGKGG